MLPSVFMSASCRSSSSVTGAPSSEPLSRTPTKTTPATPWPGRSFANAQIASRMVVGASPASDSLNSTRSDSPSSSNLLSSMSRSAVTITPSTLPAYAPRQSGIRGSGMLQVATRHANCLTRAQNCRAPGRSKGPRSSRPTPSRRSRRAASASERKLPHTPTPDDEAGSPGRTRTCDLAVNSRSLYQLSYRGMCLLAAEPGFEPELRDSKSLVLPLHHSAATPSTPPLTLDARSARGPRARSWCRRPDSNRHEGYPSTVFETVASTNSATPARSGGRPRRGARPQRDGAPSAASIAAPPAPGQ